MNFEEIYEKYSDEEYLEFDRVENKLSNRPNIHAFILLDKLVPGNYDIVSAAEHDLIFLSIGVEELSNTATEQQMIELIRCGVRYESSYNCLAMFV